MSSVTSVTVSDEEGASATDAYELQIAAVVLEAQDVISLRLRDAKGAELPPWSPGAHLDFQLPSGRSRQYSLCGDPADRSTYRVAVLRENDGRGGSVEMHDLPLVGRKLKVRGPKNHFPLTPSPDYLFIAGGIGITPILAMITSLPREASWTLHYSGRSRTTMAFVDEAVAIGGDRVHLYPADETGRLDLEAVLGGLGASTAVYCCGPGRLMQSVDAIVRSSASHVQLFTERFAPADDHPGTAEVPHDDSRFEVELARSNRVLTVPPDRSVLAVVRDVLPDVPFSCEEGYCGSCETRVMLGAPEHRDDLLSDEERAEGGTMMICVSRSKSPRLVLDL